MQSIKLSFIIPCYNGEDTLYNSVNSIVQQKIDNYEIIIVNDGSTDRTLEVANKIAEENHNVFVLSKPNGGVSSARNLGIKEATGDYIVFLDADDEFDVDFWTIVKPEVMNYRKLIIFGFDTEVSPTKKRRYRNRFSQDLISDYLLGRIYVHLCSFLTRKDIIKNNNIYFDENTYYSEDREFIVKIFSASNEYYYINKVLFHYKYRENSAMHLRQYNFRKSTALEAMSRVYKMIGVKKERHDAALIQLNLTILIHIKEFAQARCDDKQLYLKLQKYCFNYLSQKPRLMFNKYSICVWTLGALYRFNSNILFKFIKYYK